MTNEQINKAIAEACGWNECRLVAKVVLSTLRDPVAYGIPPNGTYEIACPNYCNDLNAMHEAEKVLAPSNWNRFSEKWWNYYHHLLDGDVHKTIHATARQRAEAFLRALGKWEEVQG
jgi:hypothetical protein